MKKTLAILLALMLVFSSIPVAFAEETLPVDAQAAKDLGMLVGSGDGVTNAYLATTPSRIQAAVMFLRLKGLEATAKAFTGTDNFADADQAAWAKPIMAYLKANPTLGWIGNAGNFDPNGQLDAKSYYKVLLEAIGYKQNTNEVIGDFTFTNVLEFAASKGLTKVASVTNYTVNDLATATIEALKAKVNGSEKTLAASLVDAKVITEAAAVAAGVYTPVPVALAVESVTTDNLAQLTVKFNKELKEAGDEDNYSLETSGDAVIDAASDFALQADKKTVVITLHYAAAQQEVVDLTVEDVVAADGSKLAKTVVEDVQLFDKTIPEAVAAKVVGNDVIKVTFSEPMDAAETTAADFKVDGGEIIVKGVTLVNNNTEANVELYSVLEGSNVKVEVGTGAKDFAGFGAVKKAFDVAFTEDTTAPVVVGYEDATPTGVTLIFNEDIQLVDGTDTNFYHTNAANIVDAAVVAGDIDGNKLTLNFVINELPEGTAYVYVLKEAVADLWDNENAKISYTVEVTLDKTAPTVEKVEAGATERDLEVTFSEDMDATTAQDAENYTILDKDGKDVTSKLLSATLDAGLELVTLSFSEDMTGDYSVVIDGVEDIAGNAIVKITKAFNISDVTAPLFATDFSAKLYNASAADQMLKVSFGEAMAVDGRYSVVDLEKYDLGGTNLADVKNATIVAVDGNKAVEIVLPSVADDADNGVDFATIDILTLARVADAAGNTTAELSGEVALSGAGNVGIDTVELTSKNTIVVTLLDKLSKFTASDFAVFVDSDSNSLFATTEEVAVSRVRQSLNEDGMSAITFTLANNVATDGTSSLTTPFDVMVATKAVTTSENVYGETLVANTATVVADKAAPTVTAYTFKLDGTIVLSFSEELDAASFATSATAKNGFSVSGGKLVSALYDAGTNTVILTADPTSPFTVNTNVYYTSVFGVKDASANGNKLADINRTDVLTAE